MVRDIDDSKKNGKNEFTVIVEEPINWDEEAYEVPEIETIDLGNNLEEVRDSLSNIDFNEPAIHILNLQPGVGKTHKIKSFLKQQNSFLMVTARHELISSEYGKIGKHWKGLSKENCEFYKNIKPLASNNVPIPMICTLQHCDKKKRNSECTYWKQFITRKAVAPFHYLSTNRVLYKSGEKEFKFDTLVVDEAMKEFNTIEVDVEQINESIDVIKKYDHSIESYFNDFRELLDDNDLPSINLTLTLYGIRNDALKEAITSKNTDDIKQITKFNPFDLRKYAYYNSIYKNNLPYPEPSLHNVLDLALSGVPIIFLDATFDKNAFEVLLRRYAYENLIEDRQLLLDKNLDSFKDLKIKIYQSHIINQTVNIYKMDKDHLYYKNGTFFDYTTGQLTENGKKYVEELRNYIKSVKRKYTNIGIISYEDLVGYFNDLGDTAYFYNLRGSNTIKDVEALFIIGTPQINIESIVTDYNELSLTDYKPEDFKRLTNKKKRDGKFYPLDRETGFTLYRGFDEKKPNPLSSDYDDLTEPPAMIRDNAGNIIGLDYNITDFDYNISESEKYQALHRARPLINEKLSSIFIFGDIPDKIRREFPIKTLNKTDTRSYFNGIRFNGIYPLPLYQLIQKTYYKNNTLSSSDICKELRIYKNIKKSGYNTGFVTAILKGNVNPIQIKIIDEALKNDINSDLDNIKKLLKSSKVSDKFIEDCIFYAIEGNFIKY